VLIIPDSEILDPDVVQEVLLPWVRDQGGQLLVTANSGKRLGESGNFDLNPKGFSTAPLTGVASTEDASSDTVVSVGSGQVLYLSKDIGFDFYLANDQVEREGALPRFRECLSKLLPEKTSLFLEFLKGDSPNLGATLYQSKSTNRLFIDLNNSDVDLTADTMKKTSPIKVSVHLPESMRDENLAATAVAPDSTPEVEILSQSGGHIELSIGPIEYYAGVIVKKAIE
ncbi:MAG: hypothetical protein KC964_06850, partial [Candidatus Omnitrophica bacterium]|nr:hypothetical protein [Candidatus Omnitrophota bacterium]